MIVADENIEREIVERLRGEGLGIEHIADTKRGATDDEVLEHASRLGALLLTEDKDFGELVIVNSAHTTAWCSCDFRRSCRPARRPRSSPPRFAHTAPSFPVASR